MQEEFRSEDVEAMKLRPISDLDFSFSSCRTEKLQEQMSQEKAVAVLKLPTGRGGNVPKKSLVSGHFLGWLHRRPRILSNDPQYEVKVENRHVMDVLVHESFQYMMKNGQLKTLNKSESKENNNTQAYDSEEASYESDLDSDEFAEKLSGYRFRRKKVTENGSNQYSPSNLSSASSSRSASPMGSISKKNSPTREWKVKKAQNKLSKSNFDLRRAIQKQEEHNKSANSLIQRMIDTYVIEEEDPILSLNSSSRRYKPKIALLD